MKKYASVLICALCICLGSSNILAQDCDNRFVTLINPVRGRNLWIDQSVNPLLAQYSEITKHRFTSTWLLQYDAITDKELVDEIKNFEKNQEIGVFLEVSPDLANAARVYYPHLVAWDDPNAVFLSGYKQSERRKLIDTLFKEYKKIFGVYPKSVGAWWIDSYSLDFMKKNYDITSALIVADQKTTDDYGVWGQWWGVPYYPSKANILVPGRQNDKVDVVVLQWAQRDLSLSYGADKEFSNYSLQANDYTERGLDTSFFSDLVDTYQDCNLPIGQVTVGLETGIESVKSFGEYQNQLQALSQKNIKSVTMSEFASEFHEQYQYNPEILMLQDDKSKWKLTPNERSNFKLNDEIVYQNNISFSDYFVQDNGKFLDRRLPINKTIKNEFPPYLGMIIGFFVLSLIFLKSQKNDFLISIFMSFLLFLPLFRSFSKFGFDVFFSSASQNLLFMQILLSLISPAIILVVLMIIKSKVRDYKLFILSLFSSFILFVLLSQVRYTVLDQEKYFGFLIDPFRFLGVTNSLTFVNTDFSSVVAGSMLKFDWEAVWQNNFLAFIVLPLSYLIIAFLLYFLAKKSKMSKKLLVIIACVSVIIYLNYVFLIDPRLVM